MVSRKPLLPGLLVFEIENGRVVARNGFDFAANQPARLHGLALMTVALKLLHQCLQVHIVPAFDNLATFDDSEGRACHCLLFAAGRKAEMIAQMGHGDSPADGDPVSLCDYLLHVYVHIWESAAKGAMYGLKALGANKDRIRFGE